jgi:hypothetical protein
MAASSVRAQGHVGAKLAPGLLFLTNQRYGANFAKISSILTKEQQFFRNFVCPKYFKNHNMGLGSCSLQSTGL